MGSCRPVLGDVVLEHSSHIHRLHPGERSLAAWRYRHAPPSQGGVAHHAQDCACPNARTLCSMAEQSTHQYPHARKNTREHAHASTRRNCMAHAAWDGRHEGLCVRAQARAPGKSHHPHGSFRCCISEHFPPMTAYCAVASGELGSGEWGVGSGGRTRRRRCRRSGP